MSKGLKKSTVALRQKPALEEMAKKHKMTVTELINSYLAIGLLLDKEISGSSEKRLIIKDDKNNSDTIVPLSAMLG